MKNETLTANADGSFLNNFKLSSLSSLQEIGDIEMLTDIIPRNNLTLLYAQGGGGKTTLIGALIKEILENKPEMDVLLLDYDQAKIRNRDLLMTLLSHESNNFGLVDVSTLDESNKTLSILDTMKDLSNKVIVIDALQGIFARYSKDINKAVDASQIMNKFKAFRDKGATVIIIHHSNKVDKLGFATFRGSAVIIDSVDNLYEVQKVDRTKTELTLKILMDHKYSFLPTIINPTYKIDRDLNYTTTTIVPQVEEIRLPKGVPEDMIPLIINIVQENKNESKIIIETRIREKLNLSYDKVKRTILFLEGQEIVEIHKVDGTKNKKTISIL